MQAICLGVVVELEPAIIGEGLQDGVAMAARDLEAGSQLCQRCPMRLGPVQVLDDGYDVLEGGHDTRGRFGRNAVLRRRQPPARTLALQMLERSARLCRRELRSTARPLAVAFHVTSNCARAFL